jgi:hypothetical protein
MSSAFPDGPALAGNASCQSRQVPRISAGECRYADAVVIPAWDDVNVYVEDGLPSHCLVGLEQGETLWGQRGVEKLGHAMSSDHDLTGLYGLKIEQSARVPLRDDQGVALAQRSDVQESESVLVLVDEVAGSSTRDDGTKDAG